MLKKLRPRTATIILLLLLYALFLLHPINLITADLGRHIRNGEIFFQTREILSKSFYSYTEPDYFVINHHWGSGVIFFLIFKIFGFLGVHLFFIFLSLAAFFIFLKIAQKRMFAVAAFVSLIIIPLLNERTEIRPEVFSYFFVALFFWLLLRFQNGRLSYRSLFLLPLLEIIWVNTHIYFFLGPTMIGVFLLENLLLKKQFFDKRYIYILFLTTAVTFINPFGLSGFLNPLTIFKNYGYRLVENQPVLFIEKLIYNPNFLIFKIVFCVMLISFIFVFFRARKEMSLVNLILAIGFSAAAWMAIRNFTIFGLFALPIITENLSLAFKFKSENEILDKFILGLVTLVLVLTLSRNITVIYPYLQEFGWGQAPENSLAADFFKETKITGPIFNNYDIGSYLIFYFFPKERVFVDNRPEAYSVSFFRDHYIPMQEDEHKWQEEDQKFKFNAIIFSYRDATPWGQNFLIKRVQDPQWAAVFADQQVIIFLKRNDKNQSVIQRFEIPKENFRIVKSS